MTVTEFLAERSIETAPEGHRHVSANWVGVSPCPFCGSREFHLGIHKSGGASNCWRCGPHDVFEALAELTGLTRGQVAALIDRQEPPKRERPKGKLTLPAGLGTMRQCHIDYLRGRGFDPAELQRLWQLRGIGVAARLAWRIFIPVIHQGETVSWITRSVAPDAERRYVSAPAEHESLPARSLLYGEDFARHAIIVCEGPADAWRIGPGAVATLGVNWTKAQLLRMSAFPVRAVCFDREQAAQRRAKQLCEALAIYPGETTLVLLDADDPANASDRETEQLRKRFLS